jgi:hypothetical protein
VRRKHRKIKSHSHLSCLFFTHLTFTNYDIISI